MKTRNLGNRVESTMLKLAENIPAIKRSSSPIEFRQLPGDDPVRYCLDISLATQHVRNRELVELLIHTGRPE